VTKTLREVYDQNSIVDCKLSAYALDNIVFNALHEKIKCISSFFFNFNKLLYIPFSAPY